jgi:hypothetical protein
MPMSLLYVNQNGEQVDFQLLVHTRPNLRDGMGEMLMYRGRNILETMFDKCTVDPTVTCFDMEFPERWANILELRAIPERMLVCFPNLKEAVIRTHSVYLIQCVHASHIGICDKAEKYPEKNYGDLNARFCDHPEEMKGLHTFTPDKGIQKVGS